jgi:predicted acylesterase/phospholipase RssA
MPLFRGVVFSGGGARGAYGAGVLKALAEFERIKPSKYPVSHFYIGSSVGALNAAMAAQGHVDELVTLHKTLTTKDVLGETSAEISAWQIFTRSRRVPFAYFSNAQLQALIERNVLLDLAEGSHLVITATNYRTGELASFYCSSLIKDFAVADATESLDRQRLRNYFQIATKESLVQSLLASCAIPFFFPPVEIDGATYVDGGVGNNTPTRQAAYFVRFLEDLNRGQCDFVICIVQDPTSFVLPPNQKATMSKIINRTLDVYQHELSHQMLTGWERINNEVRKADERRDELVALIETASGIDTETRKQLLTKVEGIFHLTNAVTHRRNVKLLQVRPSTVLPTESTLAFDPQTAVKVIRRGYEDCLTMFEQRAMISSTERQVLSNLDKLGF